MIKKLNLLIYQLQQENKKAWSLAFIRVALCIWFLKELFFRYPAFEVLYGHNSYLKTKPEVLIKILHLDFYWLQVHYKLVIAICVLATLLHLFGIAKNLGAIAMFFCYSILRAMNTTFENTGDEMCLITAFYLCFANSYQHFTLFKSNTSSYSKFQPAYNLISNLAAYSMLLNLCLAYFYTGYFKLENKLWLQGTGLQYSFYNERFNAFAFSKVLATKPWIYVPLNYGIMIFELSLPFLIWFKKCRNVVVILALIMHTYIYCTMLIFGMTFTFLLQYPLFYSNTELQNFYTKIKYIMFYKKTKTLTQ